MNRNYLSQMLYALTSPYSRKDYENEKRGLAMETSIGKLFSIFAYGLNFVDEQAELIRVWDDIDNARGKVLDRYGANWGVKRISPNDAIYQIAIKVKVLSQLSGGDIDTVIRAAGTLLDVEYSEVLLEEIYPAKIALYVDWELLSDERKELIEAIAEAIKRILAAGVGFRLYIRTYRTSRLELSLSRAAFIESSLTGEPVGRDREGVIKLRVGRGGYVENNYTGEPVSQDRQSARELWIGHGDYVESNYLSSLHGEDKLFSAPVIAAHGAARTALVSGYPPDAERPLRASQSRAGGVVYHSHIKSKRVN